MLRVTSLAEKEIHEIGEAFANHNYVDGVDKRDKYMSLGMECVGTRKISEGSYLYDLMKWTD